jgi:hypothetical protein
VGAWPEEIRKPKPDNQNPKSEIRNPKSEMPKPLLGCFRTRIESYMQ